MLKDEWGHACKVCERPFTSFRWRPAGDGMRAKKTEVCQTCARAKNVCQTCLLDLQYGLPVQVRDALLLTSAAENSKNGGNGTGSTVSASLVKKLNCNGKMIPQSDGVKEYTVVQTQRLIDSGVVDKLYNNNPSSGQSTSDQANDAKTPQSSKALTVNQRLIEKLKKRSMGSSSSASTGPSTSGGGIAKYNRNRVRVCSFFFKGKCKRGLYCPYRHELSENQRQQQQQQNTNAARPTDQSGSDGGNIVGNDNDSETVVHDLDKQNLRDRYYGVNDPVAKKIFHRTGVVLTPDGKLTAVPKRPANSSSSKAGGSQASSPPVAPLDRSIKSAFIGGVNMRVSEAQIRAIFTPGAVADSAIRQVTMRPERGFAFVEFDTRQKAEVALEKCHGTHVVNGGTKLMVNWGKGKKKRGSQHDGGHAKQDLTSTNTNFVTPA